jgi:hypothetical protein
MHVKTATGGERNGFFRHENTKIYDYIYLYRFICRCVFHVLTNLVRPLQAARAQDQRMVLGATEKAAVEGFLRSKRGQRALHDSVATKLLEFFAAKSISLPELSTTPPASKAELDEWLNEWRDYAHDAALTDRSDINNVARWIQSLESTTASGVRSGKAHAVADALTKKGIAIDRGGELTIAAALMESEQGELSQQSRSVEVIWIIYTGQSPGEEDRDWFIARRQAAVSLVAGEDPPVDIRLCKSYAKQHSTTRVVTLERALLSKDQHTWPQYCLNTVERLNSYGFVAAAMRFNKVVSFARNQNPGDQNAEKRYLVCYFFNEHLGKGLPVEKCYSSALLSNTSGGGQMVSTVQEDNASDTLAQLLTVLHTGTTGAASSGGGQHMQMQPLQQPAAPPPAVLPPPQGESCSFCGNPRHSLEKCTHMLKARKEHRLAIDAAKLKKAGEDHQIL